MDLLIPFALLFTTAHGSPSAALWSTSGHNDERLAPQPPIPFTSKPTATSAPQGSTYKIKVDPTVTSQVIEGFGGALTQSSAAVYNQLPEDLQRELIEAYYGESGIKFSTGRLPIHSCDFSPETYTFDDTVGDKDLADFDAEIMYDQKHSLPLIKAAVSANPDLKLFGSPWSPPAWMKDTNNMLGGGALLPEFARTWAEYFSKWITAYKEQGVSVWGVTVQNEPENAASWESCIYTAEETRDFVAEHLGPVLSGDHPEVKIFGFDHNKDHVKDWADTLFSQNSTSNDYVDGIAFHWYSGACFDNVQSVYDAYPDKTLLPSEACYELTVLDDDETPEEWLVSGTWSKGEGYGYDIIGDLNAGASGWTDWNILLDQQGGPNHVGNYCDAGAIGDVGSDQKALYFHPQYYYLGHFSKFLAPGSVKIQGEVVKEGGGDDDDDFEVCAWPYGKCDESMLHATTFQDVDGNIVVVAMNCGSDDKDFELEIKDVDGTLSNTLGPNTIHSYVISV